MQRTDFTAHCGVTQFPQAFNGNRRCYTALKGNSSRRHINANSFTGRGGSRRRCGCDTVRNVDHHRAVSVSVIAVHRARAHVQPAAVQIQHIHTKALVNMPPRVYLDFQAGNNVEAARCVRQQHVHPACFCRTLHRSFERGGITAA